MRFALFYIIAGVLFINLASSFPSNFTLVYITELSPVFESWRSSIHLAVDDINNNPDLLPDTHLDLELVFADSIPKAITTLMDCSARNITLICGNEFDETLEYTGVVATSYGLAQLSPTATTPLLSDGVKFPYFSRVIGTGYYQMLSLIDVLQNFEKNGGLGWTEVAIVVSSLEYGVELAETFIENAGDDFTVLSYQQFLTYSTEFDIELQEVKDSGARVIFLFCYFFELADFLNAANDYGLIGDNYVWATSDANVGINGNIDYGGVEHLMNGMLGTFEFLPNSGAYYDSFSYRWMNEIDTEQYPGIGVVPPDGFILFVYDSIHIAAHIISGLIDEGVLNNYPEERIAPEVWVDKIRKFEYDGLTGKTTFKENGDRNSLYSIRYFDNSENIWVAASTWDENEGLEFVRDVVWFSGSTDLPDLDIREPFNYWSCHDKDLHVDETGKTVIVRFPGSSDVDDIDSSYHCDGFIDCHNISDESVDCSNNYTVLFIVFGIITGILIFVSIGLILFVLLFGIVLDYRRLRQESPAFLILLLSSVIMGYLSVYAWFGKPHPVACGFQPWLLGLSANSMITALSVKNFRIWRIFKNTMKKQRVTDLELLVLWFIIMLPSIVILIIWTIVSTPTATLVEQDGKDHYICTTAGFTGEPGGIVFFSIFVAYSALVLLIGAFISYLVRNVPSQYNESKLMTISIYNLVFLAIVVIPVFLVLRYRNPFSAWIIRTVAILYAFTATTLIQFLPILFGVFIINRGKNVKVFETSLRLKASRSESESVYPKN